MTDEQTKSVSTIELDWGWWAIPICSVYGIFTYICPRFMVDVGKCSTHRSFGICWTVHHQASPKHMGSQLKRWAKLLLRRIHSGTCLFGKVVFQKKGGRQKDCISLIDLGYCLNNNETEGMHNIRGFYKALPPLWKLKESGASISLDTQGHLLRSGIWTPRTYRSNILKQPFTSGGIRLDV